MSSRLSVVFYIILCFEIGLVLTVLPWVPHGWWGLSDWGNNYFLLLASRKVGFGVQRFVASGWVRGAGLGNDQFPQDGAGAGRWPAICEKLAREAAATD